MKTPAIISALTVVGSIAFAAGQSQTVRVMPDEEKPLEGEMPPMMAMGAGSCDYGALPQDNWFSPVLRPITMCPGSDQASYWSREVASRTDVNGDGSVEFFWVVTGSNIFAPSNLDTVLMRQTYEVVGGVTYERWVSCLRRQVAADALRQTYPQVTYGTIGSVVWRDMDADGDADLVVRFQSGGGNGVPLSGWFENIGYEKPDPPLAADINQDGAVNGDDLGLLLAAWTIP